MNSENFSLYSATTKGRLILLSILISLFSHNVEAQISHGGRPASFRIAQFDDKEIIYSPKVPFNLDKTGDIEKQCTAYEFGKILPLNLNLKNSDFGKRKIDSQGNLIWKARVFNY